MIGFLPLVQSCFFLFGFLVLKVTGPNLNFEQKDRRICVFIMPNTTVTYLDISAWESEFEPYKFRAWMEKNSAKLTYTTIFFYLVTIFSVKKYSTFKNRSIMAGGQSGGNNNHLNRLD